MDAKRIHDDITQLLYKVEEQYGRIIHFKDSIPLIEVDLALKDVRDLYESFLDLRTIAEIKRRKAVSGAIASRDEEPIAVKVETPKAEPKVEAAPIVVPEPVQKEEDKVPEVIAEKEVQPEIISEVVAEELAQLESEIAPEVKEEVIEPVQAEEKPVEEKIEEAQPEKKEETPSWQKTAATSSIQEDKLPPVSPKKDLLQERQKDFVPTVRKIEFKPEPVSNEAKKESIFEKAASLYDKIAKPTEKTVASQAGKQPISNIKNSIGINEKFAYLKDLFKNNINEYNEALDKLNNFENYEEAEDFFQDLKNKYKWDPESKAFQGLADLLNRRYLHNA
ncbi:MAG: hypothetical protein WED33_06460 [Bacteroidia bacterium]